MSHTPRRILYGFTLLLLIMQLVHQGLAAPGRQQTIASSNSYTERVLQISKAAEIANYMNKNVNPCDNFYEFACGNWMRINRATTEKELTGTFQQISQGFLRKVKQFLIKENDQLDTPEEKQIRSFYRSCTSVTRIDESYRNKLKEVIREFGGMPVLEESSWKESEFDWIETIGKIANTYGQSIIMKIEIQPDWLRNIKNTVHVSYQEFPLLTRGMYLNSDTEYARTNYVAVMADNLIEYLNIESKLAQSTAAELMSFEVELAKGLPSETEEIQASKVVIRRTISEMQKLYGSTLDIQRFVNITLGEDINDLYDMFPEYKKNLVEVIQRTPKRIVANYIFYNLIKAFWLEMNKQESNERERNCQSITIDRFAKNVNNMIYRRHNTADTAAELQLMWSELQMTFKQTLQSDRLNWLSPKSRELAIEKITAMKLEVNSHLKEDLSKDFVNIHLSDDDYIDNLKQIFKKTAATARAQIHLPIGYQIDNSFSAIYKGQYNAIMMPVAWLQPYYLWAASYSNPIKYGAMGTIIGHEIIHGFDAVGRRFNAQGNLHDWMDEKSYINFNDRQKCFSEQYSNYSFYDIKLPKSEDQSENIADNSGVRLAFDAFRNWQNAQESSLNDGMNLLPGLNYTNNQLFFISYAQSRCSDVAEEQRLRSVISDNHAPEMFRVIGPLSNFDEFSKEFNCALGTQMNPVRKCELY
ncbi:neprilysin-1-like [Drosophila albomicans]|uniref:Neprilysin-1-like n=1 Tax=Drosophila albomicans TaxID=7291 RepID=A0A9C6T678_DROAB|nr:neprilysin-1-like [Drosophila albomicans]